MGAVSGVAGVTTDDQTNAEQRRKQGEFVRGVSTARNWISIDSNATYPPAAGRYHLYVAYNCPWCHRVLLARAMLGLEDVISVDVCFPNRSSEDEQPFGANMWKFCPEGQVGANGKHTSFPECTKDTLFGKSYIKEIYQLAGIDDQKSVPVLFDKQTNTVVSNESAEIVRMMGTAMKKYSTTGIDLYPADKAEQIDALNDWIYTQVANGSYKAGFSSNQTVYETAYHNYFAALDKINDEILSKSKFLTGDVVTEADLRLFPTLFRHDPVYYMRFKLNQHYLYDYPYLWRWMSDMMALTSGMAAVSNEAYLAHCKQGYFGRTGNGTIPLGPPGYPDCYKEKNWTPSKESKRNYGS